MSAEPDTKIPHLTPDMQFLALASDGLWKKVRKKRHIHITTKFWVQIHAYSPKLLIILSIPCLLFQYFFCLKMVYLIIVNMACFNEKKLERES